jgi:amino acid transporter
MRKVTLPQLAAATYLMVSGGPYGIEELVQTCGYPVALLLLLAIPLLWSLPVGLMVGELSAAIPAEGGFYVWVRRAMGPFWGFQEAWLSLMASVFDMAVYPTVFVLTLGRFWPAATQGVNGFAIGVAFVLVCVIWNLFGATAVGEGSEILGVLLLGPFVVLAVLAFVRHTPVGVASASGPAHADWAGGILVAMWNYMGWDNASTIAGEVENPQRTYPRVMLLALAAVVLTYVVPVAAVWKMGFPVTAWATGSWVNFATQAAGQWLGLAVMLGALISTLGSFNSLTLSLSRLPMVVSQDGYAPRFLARTLKNGVPWAAIVTCAIAWIAALQLNFDRLLMLDILLYGASLILEFIALALLRIREPKLPRPFVTPGGRLGAMVLGAGPVALLITAAIRSHDEKIGAWSALAVGLAIMAAGVVAYWIARLGRAVQPADPLSAGPAG